jgi:ribosome-binding protein aMBF1 (putative translation factor)
VGQHNGGQVTTMEVGMPLGERVKELRKEMGWSQGELADKVGTDGAPLRVGRAASNLDSPKTFPVLRGPLGGEASLRCHV